MSDYTPTTEDIKRAHRNFRISAYRDHSDVSDGEFDRWLAEHNREVAEKARAEAVERAAQIAEDYRKVDSEFGPVSGDWDGWTPGEVPGFIAAAIRKELGA